MQGSLQKLPFNNEYMDKIYKALTSRTAWTIVIMFIIGGVHAVTSFIPANLVTPIEGVLSFLAIYFKVNPSQEY